MEHKNEVNNHLSKQPISYHIFSTNDVYEIEYSDYDQETDSSQASGNLEKLNKSLACMEPLLTSAMNAQPSMSNSNNIRSQTNASVAINEMTNTNGKQYIKEHYMESNSDNELDETDYRYNHRTKSNDKSSTMNQIIEDYKIEVGTSINHHSPSPSDSHQLNNSRVKSAINGAKLNQSTNAVIKNYLKTKDQDIDSFNNNSNRISITTSNKKLNDLSKRSLKCMKDFNKPKLSNATMSFQPSKAQPKSALHHQPHNDKMKKPPKSPSAIGQSPYNRQNSNLDEFQIEKVVSWMSVNEENFSEFEFSMAGGGQSHDNKANDGVKNGDHDSTYQEIADIIKEIEHDRKDSEDFKTLKTDVEFKLNTILNSIQSPDDDDGDAMSPSNECNDTNVLGSNNKLK